MKIKYHWSNNQRTVLSIADTGFLYWCFSFVCCRHLLCNATQFICNATA